MATSTVLPTYDVQIIPVERRLGDRRVNPNAGLPPGITEDRRKGDRRLDAQANAKPAH
jgi:hypothetical protein